MSVIDFELLALIFQPIVYLHSNEMYYPLNINTYFNSTNIYDRQSQQIIKSIQSSTERYNDTIGRKLKYDKLKYGQQNVNDVPMYYRINQMDNDIYITYVFFYGYNGVPKIFGFIPIGRHYADIEHITLKLTQISSTYSINSIYLSYHANGHWIKANNIEYDGTHPILYSAKFTHAMYSKPGAFIRFYGFANDVANKGIKWMGPLYRLKDKNDVGYQDKIDEFVYYNGNIGQNHVGGFKGRQWWNEPWNEKVSRNDVWIPINIRTDYTLMLIMAIIYVKLNK